MDDAVDPYKIMFWKNRNAWLYEIARDKNLKAVSVRIGLLFATFLVPDTREYLSPGYEWLMENGHVKARATLSSALKELASNGYLVIDRNHHHSNTYRFPFDGEKAWEKSQSSKNELRI